MAHLIKKVTTLTKIKIKYCKNLLKFIFRINKSLNKKYKVINTYYINQTNIKQIKFSKKLKSITFY